LLVGDKSSNHQRGGDNRCWERISRRKKGETGGVAREGFTRAKKGRRWGSAFTRTRRCARETRRAAMTRGLLWVPRGGKGSERKHAVHAKRLRPSLETLYPIPAHKWKEPRGRG